MSLIYYVLIRVLLGIWSTRFRLPLPFDFVYSAVTLEKKKKTIGFYRFQNYNIELLLLAINARPSEVVVVGPNQYKYSIIFHQVVRQYSLYPYRIIVIIIIIK